MHYYEARKLTSIKGFDQGCKPWVFLQPLSILGFDNCIDERIGGPERRGSCTRGPQMLEISQKNILCRNIFLEIVVGFKGLHFLPCLLVDRS